MEAQKKHIPSKEINQSKNKKHGIPIAKNTFQATKKKHGLWQRCMDTRDPEKYKQHTRQRNKVRASYG